MVGIHEWGDVRSCDDRRGKNGSPLTLPLRLWSFWTFHGYWFTFGLSTSHLRRRYTLSTVCR